MSEKGRYIKLHKIGKMIKFPKKLKIEYSRSL